MQVVGKREVAAAALLKSILQRYKIVVAARFYTYEQSHGFYFLSPL
jgi:hypothetical protein